MPRTPGANQAGVLRHTGAPDNGRLSMPSPAVPFSLPDITDAEIRAVTEVLKSGWLTTGPRAAEFEEAFRAFVAAPHALAVNSCSAALHLALAALDIGAGDEVITTPLTFCATVNAILAVGAKPVLADIGADLNLDPEAARAAITPATRAMLPVHVGGLPCDMDRFWQIAEQHRLHVLEDAAHAAGALYRGVPVGGGRSDAVAFSFYANKNLTTGEGGMVVTPLGELDARMRVLSLQGIARDAWRRSGAWQYEVVERGFKCNMSDIMAAIGLEQLRRLDSMNARRAEIAAEYTRAFSAFDEIETPPDRPECRHAWHLYVLRLNPDRLSIDRDEFITALAGRGIAASVHFIPLPLHPYYQSILAPPPDCPRAMSEYPRLVSLPLYSRMTDGQARYVIDSVLAIVAANRRKLVAPASCA